ncbi:MAG: aminotransferase class IV [Flavobacteriaceae bacterium]|nr:aminotransferase class IV [Flavobacteriaceae bacterium]
MININGTIIPSSEASISINNRGFTYGDAAFETLRYAKGKILFWEDHYFRLMATMRILRMEIPMNFTPEYLEGEMIKLIEANELANHPVRIKLMVSRKSGGYYTPETNDIDYLIKVSQLERVEYQAITEKYVVDLYKDFYIPPGLLSNLKTNNRLINILAGIYAKEQQLENCLLLNADKMVVEALNGNIFLVKDNIIKTPPLSDGCLKGIMRKQIIDLVKADGDLQLVEASISPFELQKADELFITNCIAGIAPVSQYRKKIFINSVAKRLTQALNSRLKDQL